VVEIGCGDGHMLDLMLLQGVASATGFDPSMAGRASPFAGRAGFEIIPEYFSSSQLDRPLDAVLCRHVLEHLDAPVDFLREVRAAIGSRRALLYMEVPNAGWILDSVSLWDLIYEHLTYWTQPSMETLLRRTGFSPLRMSPAYGDQFLQAEAAPSEPQPDFLPSRESVGLDLAFAFGASAGGEIARWNRRLEGLSGPAVLWGAGSKGVTFVNVVPRARESVAALVDLNPRKHGLRTPGVALPVVGPEALREIRPDLIIVANALYRDEIRDRTRELGLDPEIEVIAG
jgi:SAM-dependent methyltransferase